MNPITSNIATARQHLHDAIIERERIAELELRGRATSSQVMKAESDVRLWTDIVNNGDTSEWKPQ